MSYALFSNAVRVSKAFRSKAEVWQYAAERGLVTQVGSSEEDPPRRILDVRCAIRECAPDGAELPVGYDIAGAVARRSVNPPSATAAS